MQLSCQPEQGWEVGDVPFPLAWFGREQLLDSLKIKPPTRLLQQMPWCCIFFCRLNKQFRLVLVRNWRDYLVMGVCGSKSACPLICFVLLVRTSRRHHCGPIRPCHCVCTGWLHLGLLRVSWGVGWISSPYWMWRNIFQREWCWGRLKLCCQHRSHNIKMCLNFLY